MANNTYSYIGKQRAVKFKLKRWEAEMETVQLKLLLRYEASETARRDEQCGGTSSGAGLKWA